MILLLDTTYLLPVIGISIKDIPRDIVIKLIKRDYKVSISEISIFELSAKGAKYIAHESLDAERVVRGIKALLYDDRIDKISIYDLSILSLAFKLRRILDDFIDCLILSSAINQADILITEDNNIHILSNMREFIDLVREINPGFKIMRLKDIL